MKKFTPAIYSWIEILAKLKYALMFISDCTVFLMLYRRWYGSFGSRACLYTFHGAHIVPVNNKPSLFQIMSWCRTVDKLLSETMKAWSTHWGRMTHICVSEKIPSWLQIMVCRLFGSKPLSEPMLPYCQLDSEECISLKSYFKFKVFVHEYSLENVVYEMVAILPLPQCVNSAWVSLCYVAVTVRHL